MASSWRDPMYGMFTAAAFIAQGTTVMMRIAGVGFVCFGLSTYQ